MNANHPIVAAERAGLFATRADRGQPGDISPTVCGGLPNTTYTTVAQQARFGRWCPSRTYIVNSFAVGLVGAASINDPFELMVFDAAGTTVLYDSGVVTSKLNGSPGSVIVVGAALNLTFAADTNYWVGWWINTVGGTAAVLDAVSASSPWHILFGTGIAAAGSGSAECIQKSSVVAAPTSLTGFAASPTAPAVACREF